MQLFLKIFGMNEEAQNSSVWEGIQLFLSAVDWNEGAKITAFFRANCSVNSSKFVIL